MLIDNVHVSPQRYKLASSDLHKGHMTPVMFFVPLTKFATAKINCTSGLLYYARIVTQINDNF